MIEKVTYHIDKVEKALSGDLVYPISCEIDPSNVCMLNCSFCMFQNKHKLKPFMDYDLYLKVLDDLRAVDCRSITFTGGGEPLIHPKFNEMVDKALLFGFEIGLVTNGVLLDSVSKIDRFHFIRISINAGNRETYKRIMGADLFDDVSKSIKSAISRKGKATIGLSFVVCDENREDIEQARQLAKDLGVDYIQFKPVVSKDNVFLNNFTSNGKTIWTPRYNPEDTLPCRIAGLIGIIGANGKVYYCCQTRCLSDYEVGDFNDESIQEIWEKRLDFQVDVSKCYACRYMNYVRQYDELIKNPFVRHRNFL